MKEVCDIWNEIGRQKQIIRKNESFTGITHNRLVEIYRQVKQVFIDEYKMDESFDKKTAVTLYAVLKSMHKSNVFNTLSVQ
jgi:uncharacterized protein YktA (UPF0223 family)